MGQLPARQRPRWQALQEHPKSHVATEVHETPNIPPQEPRRYLLDTGIRFTHQEFMSEATAMVRARHGFSVFGDNNSSDCNGHGTHTAATVGGLTYGVAKNVTLWAVRAMDCAGGAKVSAILEVSLASACQLRERPVASANLALSGSPTHMPTPTHPHPPTHAHTPPRTPHPHHHHHRHPHHCEHCQRTFSCPLQAFEWIAENAIQPAVVSMSVAGDISPAVNEAARRLVEDRLIPMVVAAGNSQENACLMSPASSPWVVSVGATDSFDQRWTKSNWWVCICTATRLPTALAPSCVGSSAAV